MLKPVIFFFVCFFAVVFGVSMFLQPNDLSDCGVAPDQSISGCQTVDAIVAVSGGDTQARADGAINLYQNGWAQLLVFSGAAQDKSGPSNAAVMKSMAIEAGVPATNIVIDEYSETTQQNAENTQSIFSERGIKTAILVTSGYHQQRANLEFKKRTSGVTVLNHPIPADNDWSNWWWTTIRGWWLVASELVKILVFYIVSLWA